MADREETFFRVEESEPVDNVLEIYVAPRNPPILRSGKPKTFLKIYPVPWWKRCFYFRWLYKYYWDCCCCCCDQQAPAPAAPPATPPAQPPPPTIVLRQGMLAIGGLFYILITPVGNRCQFVVEWNAAGGVGQLKVNLDVQGPGASSFRRLVTDAGPNDRQVVS